MKRWLPQQPVVPDIPASRAFLEYLAGLERGVLDASGTLSGGRVILGADVTNNNAVANTIADITGLSFAVVAGQGYFFRAVIDYTAAATTTGARFSVNGPAATRLAYRSSYSLTTTSERVNAGLTAYDLPAAASATSAATAGNIAVIEGHVSPSASGTVVMRFASEVSASAIVAKKGSVLEWTRTF